MRHMGLRVSQLSRLADRDDPPGLFDPCSRCWHISCSRCLPYKGQYVDNKQIGRRIPPSTPSTSSVPGITSLNPTLWNATHGDLEVSGVDVTPLRI